MEFLRKLLLPFSFMYGGITFIRNKLFDWGIFSAKKYGLPVISVGNLSTGGTGKSPMIEYLVSLIKDRYSTAILSRGYKRKSSGFVQVETNSPVAQVGDEPLQFKKKFPGQTVAVCESRQMGIEKLQDQVEVILLDDAFQHRKVVPSLSILLTVYNRLYVDDWVLPAGNLREPASGADRADLVIVTKCPPDLALAQQDKIKRRLGPRPHQQIFFTAIEYSTSIFCEEKSESLNFLHGKEFTLVTGIANPKPLVGFLEKRNLHFRHLAYADHHDFSSSEIAAMEKEELIVTTEKDYMRLQGKIKNSQLFYLPITVKFLEGKGKEFSQIVLDHLKSWS